MKGFQKGITLDCRTSLAVPESLLVVVDLDLDFRLTIENDFNCNHKCPEFPELSFLPLITDEF